MQPCIDKLVKLSYEKEFTGRRCFDAIFDGVGHGFRDGGKRTAIGNRKKLFGLSDGQKEKKFWFKAKKQKVLGERKEHRKFVGFNICQQKKIINFEIERKHKYKKKKKNSEC